MEMALARNGLREPLENVACEVQHDFCQEEIADEDEHRSGDDGLGRRSPNSLRASPHRKPLVTSHGGDDEAEHQRLGEPLHEVGKHQRV